MIFPLFTLACALLARQSASELIPRLGDCSPLARQEASDRLLVIGAPAIPDLLRALDHPDAEIRGRAADLLVEMGPLQWLPEHLEHPQALKFFHHTHRPWDDAAGAALLAQLLERVGSPEMTLDSRREMPALAGLVLFRVGSLGQVDGEELILAGDALGHVSPDARRMELTLSDGAMVAAYQGELPTEPFCSVLWERLLRDPHDPQAACLLADILDPSFVRVLRSFVGRPDRWGVAALVLLSSYWAKNGQFDPTPEYFLALQSQLEVARWGLIAPVAILASNDPGLFASVLKAGYRSRNPWYQYLSLGLGQLGLPGEAYDPRIKEYLASPLEDLRREAVRAMLALASKENLPVPEIVKAAIGCKDPARLFTAFRNRLDERLALELARHAQGSIELAVDVLGDYGQYDPVVNTFCASLPDRIEGEIVFRLLKLLGDFSAKPGREGPRRVLARYLWDPDETVADRALRILVAVALEGAAPEIRSLLESAVPEHRRRGVEGCLALYRASRQGSSAESMARRLIASVLGGGEKVGSVRKLAERYAKAIQGQDASVHPDERQWLKYAPKPAEVVHYDTGWKPWMSTPIPRPYWKE